MKKSLLLASAAAALVGGFAHAQGNPVYSANVVGYHKLNVQGGASATYSLLSAPFTKFPVAKGVVSINSQTTITDSNANWAVAQFAKGTTNANENGKSTYYVEITEPGSAFEGRHFYIQTNNVNTLTIDDGGLPADIDVNELAGLSYKIVAAYRVRDLFGEPGSPFLQGGTSSANRDEILIWDEANQKWAGAIFYNLSNNSWRRGVALANDLVVDRDIGFFVRRVPGGTATKLTVVGEVSSADQWIILDPGLSLVGGQSVVNKLISATTLNSEMAWHASSTALRDEILEWDTVNNKWNGAIFNRDGTTNGWRRGVNNISNTFTFEAGKSYMFRIKGLISRKWLRDAPAL